MFVMEYLHRVDTFRHGPFTFQTGVDMPAVDTILVRINDAQQRFAGSPLSSVAEQLEKEVVVSSIFGTNSIEGGTLSEEETRQVVALTPEQVANIEQQRVQNIKAAYDYSKACAGQENWQLDVEFIVHVHKLVTHALPDEYNQPGLLRDNPKHIVTKVGSAAHGGVYKPPQCGEDVELLLQTLVSWHAQLHEQGLPALIRAPLIHFYYELIHPFWDGNGRVGRVIEATILQQAGFQYAPFAQASFYHQHIHRYFALFNQGRKQAQLKQGFPNTDFVAFFLDGILQSINNLHDRVNFLIGVMLFDSRVQHLYQGKSINDRQYAIVTQIMRHGPVMLKELAQMPWYRALYIKLTDKTKSRDLHKLKELGLLRQESTGLLMPGSI